MLTLTTKRRTPKGNKTRRKTESIGASAFSIAPGRVARVTLALNEAGSTLLSVGHGHLAAILTILETSPAPSKTQTHAIRLEQRTNSTARTGES